VKIGTSNIAAYAIMSGQTWYDSHADANWNVAGFDFKVGADTTLTYKIAGDGAPADSLPAGCVFQATGGTGGAPRILCDRVGTTYAINPTFNGWDLTKSYQGGNLVDGCVQIRFTARSTNNLPSTATFINNKVKLNQFCLASTSNLWTVETGAKFNTVFQKNTIDGNSSAFLNKITFTGSLAPLDSQHSTLTVTSIDAVSADASQLGTVGGTGVGKALFFANDLVHGAGVGVTQDVGVSPLCQGTVPFTCVVNKAGLSVASESMTISSNPNAVFAFNSVGDFVGQYNYFHNIFNLPMSGVLSNGQITSQFNVIDDYGADCASWALSACKHAAFFEILMDGGSNLGALNVQYNVMISHPNDVGNLTAPITFLSTHAVPWQGVEYVTVNVDHNLLVNNTARGGNLFTAEALSWMGYLKKIGTWNQNDNRVDNTSSLNCILNTGGAFSMTGTVSGNTLTITSLTNGGLWPGAMFHDTGILDDVTRTIQPYGSTCDGNVSTGTNLNAPTNTGQPSVTYCLGGPAVSPSHTLTTSAQTQNVPVGTINFSAAGHENKVINAVPPLNIIRLSGVQWNGTPCPSS
jgi:hypothetical protein